MIKIMQLCFENEKVKKPLNLVKNEDSADLYIYDVISADWGIGALGVVDAIKNASGANVLNVHINSPGGDVFEGRAIMAAISSFPGKTVAHIDSLCASAATSIALACDEVIMSDGAFFMIHCAHGMAFGDKTDMRNTANLLEKVEGAIVDDYVKKTCKPANEIVSMMEAETWMTAQEALDNGFVDSIAASKDKPKNMWNLSAYSKAPPALEPENKEPASAGFFMSAANANRLTLATL